MQYGGLPIWNGGVVRIASIVVLSTVALVAGLCASLYRPPQLPTPAEPRLDAGIPAPDRAQYRAIRDARDWRNPYLDVSNEGYRLKSASVPEGRFVARDDLRRALTELPVGDWPHGRVAVVQSPSIVPADKPWLAEMNRNVDAAIEVLKALDADWWAWPP